MNHAHPKYAKDDTAQSIVGQGTSTRYSTNPWSGSSFTDNEFWNSVGFFVGSGAH